MKKCIEAAAFLKKFEYDEEALDKMLSEKAKELGFNKNAEDYSAIVIGDFVVAWQPIPDPWKGE